MNPAFEITRNKPRRRLLAAALAAGIVALTGCADVAGPRTVTLSEADLARLLEKRFPTERRVMEVIDFRVDRPQLRLLPETNRIATEFAVSAADKLFGRSFAGRLALESALRYDEPSREVRLTQVRVNRLQFDGMPPQMQNTVSRLGSLLAEQLLDGLAVYTFRQGDLDRGLQRGVQPGAVTVTSRGVEITLVPVPR